MSCRRATAGWRETGGDILRKREGNKDFWWPGVIGDLTGATDPPLEHQKLDIETQSQYPADYRHPHDVQGIRSGIRPDSRDWSPISRNLPRPNGNQRLAVTTPFGNTVHLLTPEAPEGRQHRTSDHTHV